MNELIALPEKESNQVLSRKVLCTWDEFGQIPAIKDFSSRVTAVHSRGIRFMAALQSLGQLEERYSPAQAKTIRQAFQMTLFSYQSPNAIESASEFSNALDSYTTTSGSVSRGDRNDSKSIQFIERKLMREGEIINMPFGTWILMKSGCHPFKTHLPVCFKIFKDIHGKPPEQRLARPSWEGRVISIITPHGGSRLRKQEFRRLWCQISAAYLCCND